MSVLVSGGFDPIHPGHVSYLKQARRFGNGLVFCALSSDEEVAKKHRVVLPYSERAALLIGLDLIDGVTNMPVVESLKQFGPSHYVKGKDWQGKLPEDQVDTCCALGIDIVFTNTVTHSSSQLLQGPTLEDFERLVLSQKPAEKPWEPTAAVPYDFESRKIAEGKHPELIRDVLQPKSVLDVGCGPGHLVNMLCALGVEAEGCDKEQWDWKPQARFFQADVTDVVDGEWDVIVNREVLEHLTVREIREAVTILCRQSSRLVYCTTRFNMVPKSIWDVQTSDDLDPTHISLLPKELLRSFFVLEGFKQRADLEQAMDWQQKGRCLVYERA